MEINKQTNESDKILEKQSELKKENSEIPKNQKTESDSAKTIVVKSTSRKPPARPSRKSTSSRNVKKATVPKTNPPVKTSSPADKNTATTVADKNKDVNKNEVGIKKEPVPAVKKTEVKKDVPKEAKKKKDVKEKKASKNKVKSNKNEKNMKNEKKIIKKAEEKVDKLEKKVKKAKKKDVKKKKLKDLKDKLKKASNKLKSGLKKLKKAKKK